MCIVCIIEHSSKNIKIQNKYFEYTKKFIIYRMFDIKIVPIIKQPLPYKSPVKPKLIIAGYVINVILLPLHFVIQYYHRRRCCSTSL